MPWFNVSDDLAFHRKVVAAGNAAMGLWLRAGSHCAQQLTDGLVDANMVPAMGTMKQAERLVAVGLWLRVEGGFQFHEWTADGRNPPRAVVLAQRSRNAERKAKQRAGIQAKSGESQVKEDCRTGTHGGVTGGVTGGVDEPPPLPSIKEEKKTSSSSAAQQRGHRIPSDFTVSAEMVEWARTELPGVDGRRETENFVDYWTAATGKGATKRDWAAAWRYWMRNAEKRAPRRPQNGFVSSTDQNIMQFLGQPGETNVVPLRGIER